MECVENIRPVKFIPSTDFEVDGFISALNIATRDGKETYLDSCVFFPYGNFDSSVNITRQIYFMLNSGGGSLLRKTIEQFEYYVGQFREFLERKDVIMTTPIRDENMHHLISLKRKAQSVLIPSALEEKIVETITDLENAIVMNNIKYCESGKNKDPLHLELKRYSEREYDRNRTISSADITLFTSALSAGFLDGENRNVLTNDGGVFCLGKWMFNRFGNGDVPCDGFWEPEQLKGVVVSFTKVLRESGGHVARTGLEAYYRVPRVARAA